MFYKLVKEFEKDAMKTAVINNRMVEDPGFAARYLYKRYTGSKLDPLRAMIVSAAFSKDPVEALKPIIEQLEMRKK